MTSVNGWTPVAEAVPDDDRYVLVSFGGKAVPAVGCYYLGEWLDGCDENFCSTVKAWRPLPPDYIEDN